MSPGKEVENFLGKWRSPWRKRHNYGPKSNRSEYNITTLMKSLPRRISGRSKIVRTRKAYGGIQMATISSPTEAAFKLLGLVK